MAIVIQESLRGLFYTPYYAALTRGAYEQEGLEVRFVAAPKPGVAHDALFDGSADVAWGGPMRVNQVYEQRPDCDLVCFGEAVTRDPFMLIGGSARPDFTMAALATARIGTVSEVPTPWLCLQDDLRRARIDPDTLNRVPGGSMTENAARVRRGDIDVAQIFQPIAEELIASGAGHLWYAAAARGPCSYTTFYARRGVLADKRDDMLKLVRGLYRTQRWLHRAEPPEIVAAIRPYFPDIAEPLLRAAIVRYLSLGIWGQTPVLPRDGYERLVACLVSGNFAKGTPFEVAVDNSLAEQAVAENPV
ncbi:MAG TPA: ABC transporter substrate-binding protein [Stellaceae bacterium]|jgi:NitT/TauT family transport system substrate-binding protein|nr:ABC transporter substrate-binding protein [Stellaceae bacterium]